jgi:hypothetical protein
VLLYLAPLRPVLALKQQQVACCLVLLLYCSLLLQAQRDPWSMVQQLAPGLQVLLKCC